MNVDSAALKSVDSTAPVALTTLTDSQPLQPKFNAAVFEDTSPMGSPIKLLFYALGIFVCYFYFGVLQEEITKTQYGPKKEKFVYAQSLLIFSCIMNVVFAKLMLSTFLKQGVDTTRRSYYIIAAMTYLGAMLASTISLQFVNYTTQVVGKSCKPIPVMVLGVLIGGKRYSLSKYLSILVVVLGVGLFIYKDKKASQTTQSITGTGELLLLLSLSLDGITGAVQERMKSEYQTKSGHMMLMMNFWATVCLVFAQLFTQEMWAFVAFLQRYPSLFLNILLFALTGALGQTLIFRTVSEYGPLPCSVVTTTRKFFTVLGSVVIFNNPLITRQWVGVVLVFAGLIADAYFGKTSKVKK
ncbi:solute carrier family 35 member B1 isoform X1 [Ixodes scapularis]|uniref:solute carrier family 35 member B1 isoform X1 n=2 Tax=Ixodes scapularis TaxID=6945 RepID=UPI001C383C6A|nr:solute carrier family 35 member B1 isoform X1 [Ixodes scapularis]